MVTESGSDPFRSRSVPDFESDTDPDRNRSDSDSVATFLDQDFWEDEAIFWEEIRREQVQDPLDAEDEIDFSYHSVTTAPEDSDTGSVSDTKEDAIMTNYKSVANFMEIKQPGVTTPITEPTIVQLLNFKKVLISALRQCPLNTSNKGHTYIIKSINEHRARNNNSKATLKAIPTEPVRPTEATVSRAELTY